MSFTNCPQLFIKYVEFFLRYPILKAIYGQSHPEYSSYMYLLAPISLVILNPIGFIILEVGRANAGNSGSPNADVPRRSKWHILFQVQSALDVGRFIDRSRINCRKELLLYQYSISFVAPLHSFLLIGHLMTSS